MTIYIAPGLTDRANLVGMTGSGKTYLAEELLKSRPYVVVHDSKGRINWRGYTRYTTLAGVVKAGDAGETRIIYAPDHNELVDAQKIAAFFQWIFYRQNTTVYVDEVYAVCDGNQIPHYYHACLTRGREIGISVFSSTQRPKQIPQAILSESEHYYIFRLQLPQDRLKIREIVPISESQLLSLKKFQFYYCTADGDNIGPLRLGAKRV